MEHGSNYFIYNLKTKTKSLIMHFSSDIFQEEAFVRLVRTEPGKKISVRHRDYSDEIVIAFFFILIFVLFLVSRFLIMLLKG